VTRLGRFVVNFREGVRMFVPGWMLLLCFVVAALVERYVAALRAKIYRMEQLLRPLESDDVLREELERQREAAIADELSHHF
jgi:hypothetical protein